MSNHLFQIDISYQKHKKNEDIIEIKFKNNEFVQVNYTKFFHQSKYLQDKYKYSEGLKFVQIELDKVEEKYKFNKESLKYFIELLNKENTKIPIEHYRDIYKLSEYFHIQNSIDELDQIIGKELLTDLNFTIEILFETETTESNLELNLRKKIEEFLSDRINECFCNERFKQLPNSTISRILEKSDTININHNLLLDFILKSIKNRFILFKFLQLDKMKDDKIEEFISFFDDDEDEEDNDDEHSKKIYLEYIPFNLSFIKQMRNKYNNLFNEMTQLKHESNQTKQELTNTKYELNQTKQKLNNKEDELNQERDEIENIKSKYEQVIQELDQCKIELKQVKDEFNRIKIEMKQCTQTVIVAGRNTNYQLGEKSNKTNINNEQIISPPLIISFDHSTLLSYSVYRHHSVLATNDGLLKGIGDNNNGQISSSLQKTVIDHFTEFFIKNDSGYQLHPVSAVCYNYGTLYIFSKSNSIARQLVLCDKDINDGDPVFLDIGNQQPMALFGGYYYSAAICSEGEVIFINRDSIKKSPEMRIASASLPDNEKASSVVCCQNSIVVLSLNGRVFESSIEKGNSILKFTNVIELSDKEIVNISGTYNHILAVSKEGHVFARGSNEHGKLGLGKGIETTSSFTEILSLRDYEIRAAYAGGFHSLFETREGKILSCGYNRRGELLLSSGPSEDVYSPTVTTIKGGSTFCIVGDGSSIIFIGHCPPLNTPNMGIQHYL